MSDEEDYLGVLDQLHRAKMLPHPGWGEGRLETGHWFSVGPPSHHDVGNGQYSLSVKHPGDRTGSHLISYLGRDPSLVAGRVMEQLGHPAVVGDMQEQYARAVQSGDPQGQAHNGGPGPFSSAPISIHHNYGY